MASSTFTVVLNGFVTVIDVAFKITNIRECLPQLLYYIWVTRIRRLTPCCSFDCDW
jgi:hypothetical protein